MKQLLLRVPDDMHRQLAVRAAEQGRSVNALATEILDTALASKDIDRRARLRARASAAGLRRTSEATMVSRRQRQEALAAARSIPPVLDSILDEDRERL